ncbi:uncharacterized protein LOC121655185 isoform X2 [Melanotaenia boesemani]|uniref:uncharacterized protein LOC121655185 isoform X2 n=2 Tax=Melanotaenia boesemani TaxID=1250792 RepID=UPI001C053F6C|nr:uncharacterized protein LOC121655185 isoform X2 [Melanotaenia boesemani]
MISADQTTATILHWLTCLRRDFFKLFQKHLKPQKVETDFSWAMIHAVIQAFNTITVQEYLKICFQLCQENGKVEMTVLHLCAAHMLKLVSMKLAKMQCKKDIKRFFLYCFALLQNTSTFNHILSVMKSVVFVFSARKNTNGCQKHLSALKDAINKQNADQIKVEMEDGEEDPDDSEKFGKSFSKSSPFFGPIERIVRQTEHEAEEEDDTEKNGEPNPYCCESITDILLHYAGVVPLWTGIMLTALGKTRDSNAAVENWFRTTKTVILTSKLHRRAGDFLQVQHEFVVGRLKGVSLGKKRGLPMKSSAKEAQDTDGPEALPLTQEEQWHKRTTQKRKSRYYSAPPTRKKVKLSAPQQTKGCCPPWGGEGTIGDQTIKLTNTCTVDNLLYTIHLAIKRRSGIESDLQKHSHVDPWIATLLQVHDHFNKKEWGQGKLLWLNQIGRFKGQLWNAFGTEEDMVTYRLGFLLNTELAGKCQSPDCPVVKRISGSIDIFCEDFGDFQAKIDKWASESIKSLPCKSGPNPCTENQATQQRTFVHGLPCLLLVTVVHRGFAAKKLLPTDLPELISILGGKYEPVAITYHLGTANHFVAFHRLGLQKNWHFYDGLKEMKKPGSGDVPITNTNMLKKLGKKPHVGHVLMVRDKAAESVDQRQKKNAELVKFIVEDRGAEDRLRAIVSGDERSHYSFEERWVPIIFDDDAQLDKVVSYLSSFLAGCKHLSPEVCSMIARDRIKFILHVLLSEATLQALIEKRSMTQTEAVAEVDQGQMEESERQALLMQIKIEMEKRGLP